MSTGGQSAEQIAQRGDDILHAVASTRTTIDWQKSTPWWFFVSGFVRLGWRTTHVAIALLGYALSLLGLDLARQIFGGPRLDSIARGGWPPFTPPGGNFSGTASTAFTGTLAAHYAFVFLWLAIVWGIVGGFIVRRSVVELGMRTTIGWVGAMKLVLRRLRYMIEAVGMPLICAAAMLVVPLVLGWFAGLGAVAESIAAPLLLLSVPLVLAAAWLLFLAVAGYPLMVAAVVTEKDSDAFDGLSRAAAYLFQRPVTVLLAMLVGGALTLYITQLVGSVILWAWDAYSQTYASARLGSDSRLVGLTGVERGFAGWCYAIAEWIVLAIPTALFWSLLWAGVAAIYLIVRREVDHTDYDEIDLQEPGTPLALPSTRPGPAGVTEFGPPAHGPRAAAGTEPEMHSASAVDTTPAPGEQRRGEPPPAPPGDAMDM